MIGLLRIGGIAMAAVLALLVAIAVATRLPGVQTWLGQQVAAEVGPGVIVGRVGVAVWPALGVKLVDSRVEDPEGRTVLTIGTLHLDLELATLVRQRKIAVSAVDLADVVAHVDLRKGAAGAALDVLSGLFARPRADNSGAASRPGAVERAEVSTPIEATDVTILIRPAGEKTAPLKLIFPKLDVQVRRPPGDATLSITTRAALASGSLDLSVESTARPEGRALQVKARAVDLAVDEIFAEPPGDFRRLTLDAELRRPAGARDLSGEGQLRLSEGVVSSASLGALLWKALFSLLPGNGDGASELVRSKPTTLDQLTTRFAVRQRRVELSEFDLKADDYTVAGDGTVGFDAGLDLDLRVYLTPSGLTKMLVVAELPLADVPVKLPPIPLAVTGTLQDPVVQAKISALPSDWIGYGARAAEKLPKGVLGAARSLLKDGGKRSRELLDPR